MLCAIILRTKWRIIQHEPVPILPITTMSSLKLCQVAVWSLNLSTISFLMLGGPRPLFVPLNQGRPHLARFYRADGFNNYWSITLLCSMPKILEQYVKNCPSSRFGYQLANEQHGFQTGRLTIIIINLATLLLNRGFRFPRAIFIEQHRKSTSTQRSQLDLGVEMLC